MTGSLWQVITISAGLWSIGTLSLGARFVGAARRGRMETDASGILTAVIVSIFWPLALPALRFVARQDAAELRRRTIGEYYVPEPMPMAVPASVAHLPAPDHAPASTHS